MITSTVTAAQTPTEFWPTMRCGSTDGGGHQKPPHEIEKFTFRLTGSLLPEATGGVTTGVDYQGLEI